MVGFILYIIVEVSVEVVRLKGGAFLAEAQNQSGRVSTQADHLLCSLNRTLAEIRILILLMAAAKGLIEILMSFSFSKKN
jgi:hypothetical protein